MVKVLKEMPTHYLIQWSQPEGNPAKTKLSKNKKVMTTEEMQLIVAWDSARDIQHRPSSL